MTGSRSPPRAARTFDAVPESARAARHFTTTTLRSWGCHMAIEGAAMVVAELAANAILHANTRFTVAITHAAGSVRISVIDESGREPRMNEAPGPEDTGGRGLFLVDAISRDWGIQHNADRGKMVWAELAS